MSESQFKGGMKDAQDNKNQKDTNNMPYQAAESYRAGFEAGKK